MCGAVSVRSVAARVWHATALMLGIAFLQSFHARSKNGGSKE